MLAQAGAQLVLNGFGDSSHARAEVAALGKIPGYHDADLRDVGQIEAMMRYAESTFGGVDIVINNAGIQHVAPVEQFPVDKWNDILAINLSSVFHTTRPGAAGYAPAQLGAHHQHCLSAWPPVASKEKSAYVAAKHAVVGLTKTVALGNRAQRHHLQRHLPRLGANPAGAAADRQTHRRGGRPGAGQRPAAGGKTALRGVCHPAAAGRNGAVSVQRRRRPVRGAAWNMDGGWVAQ